MISNVLMSDTSCVLSQGMPGGTGPIGPAGPPGLPVSAVGARELVTFFFLLVLP